MFREFRNIKSEKKELRQFGVIVAALLKPIQKVWMGLAILIGWTITRLILIALFYLVITPISILAKLSGKSFLDTEFDRGANSYWISRRYVKFDKRGYENQF